MANIADDDLDDFDSNFIDDSVLINAVDQVETSIINNNRINNHNNIAQPVGEEADLFNRQTINQQSVPTTAPYQSTLFGKRALVQSPRRTSSQNGSNGNLLRSSSSYSSQRSSVHKSPKTWSQTMTKRAAELKNCERRISRPKRQKRASDLQSDVDEEEDLEYFESEQVSEDEEPENAKNVIHEVDNETLKTWIYPINKSLRDYQFNIAKKALFTNVLVAIPTGLGKTFIAAVVMFNYYRWFPKGKIVFAAPTRPLVAQQMEACYYTCNIPLVDTAELTGKDPPERRCALWREKRVFFTTPQTLDNDLKSKICDPREVVCLVIDEAHRSTGDYAYCTIVRRLKSVNANFRLLALSATPGRTIDAIQDVVDNLHIGKIEIRTESSIDIQPYIFDRCVTPIVVCLCSPVTDIRDAFAKIIQPYLDKLVSANAFYESDPCKIAHFSLVQSRQKWRSGIKKSGGGYDARIGMLEGAFSLCTTLIHAMELLIKHGIVPFYKSIMQNIVNEVEKKKKNPPKSKASIANSMDFKQLIANVEGVISDPSIFGHPKLERLCGLVMEHFVEHNEKQLSGESETRVIIFAEYRDSVDEIVRILDMQKPIVKPVRFVGQSTSGKGEKGYKQKEQLQVIRDFQKGIYNTLVSTSIGEEGLDIGQVDLIILYDCHGSSIRMVQRMGRTGRKRDGNVIALMTEGKEEASYHVSKDNYQYIQDVIHSGNTIRFFDDIPRMIPDSVQPVVEKRILDISDKPSPLELESKKPTRRIRKVGGREKDPMRNIPSGIETGFQLASSIQSKKRKRELRESTVSMVDNEAFLSASQEAEVINRIENREVKFLTNVLYEAEMDNLTVTKYISHADNSRMIARWSGLAKQLRSVQGTEEGDEWESIYTACHINNLKMEDLQLEVDNIREIKMVKHGEQSSKSLNFEKVSSTIFSDDEEYDLPSLSDLISSSKNNNIHNSSPKVQSLTCSTDNQYSMDQDSNKDETLTGKMEIDESFNDIVDLSFDEDTFKAIDSIVEKQAG